MKNAKSIREYVTTSMYRAHAARNVVEQEFVHSVPSEQDKIRLARLDQTVKVLEDVERFIDGGYRS